MLRLTKNIILLLLILNPILLNAKSNDGVLAGSFLRMGLGARALGMGSAFTAIADGPETAYYNPAGVPFLENRQLMASYRFLSLDRNFNFVGFSQSIKPKVDPDSNERPFNGGLAISWIHAGVDKIDGRGLNGQHIGEFSNSENAFALTFGLSPIDIIGIGLTAKVLYNRLPNMGNDDSAVSDFSFGMDLGILIKPIPFLSVGFIVKDLNAKYDWKTDKVWEKDIDKIDRFPRTYRGGIAINWPYQWLIFAFDIEKNNKQDAKYFFGIEALPISKIALRAGLNNGSFSGGAGYTFKILNRNAQIQYALVTKKYDVASEHIFSWLFEF
ncbi:MAG: hypothetical protein JSW07_14405 [bacterium]|nr:MAG: hypothetical protein JSW07_14405 [bacterium]